MANLATVDVFSNAKVGKQQVAVNKLSYLAKGYTTGSFSSMTASASPQVSVSPVPASVHVQPQGVVLLLRIHGRTCRVFPKSIQRKTRRRSRCYTPLPAS